MHGVIELTLVFKFPWKEIARGRIIDMHRVIARKIEPGKHSSHMFSMLIVSDETAFDLMKRVRDPIMDIGAVEDLWAQAIGADATGSVPAFDPYAFNVLQACNTALDRNKPQHLRQRRPHDSRKYPGCAAGSSAVIGGTGQAATATV